MHLSRNLLNSIMGSLDEGLMVLAIHPEHPSEVIYINPQFTKIFGYSLEELQNARSAALTKLCDDQPGITKITQAVIKRHPATIEILCLRKDGTHFPSRVTINFSHKPDGVNDYLVVRNRDISRERELEERLIKSNNVLVNRNSELHNLATHDELTGLYNRRFFDGQLTRLIGFHSRHCMPMCVAFLDIDFYKQFNDTYGHLAGDEVLKKVADEMENVFLRLEDVIARYGGDEFVIVSSYENERNSVQEHFETLRKRVESLAIPNNHSHGHGVVTLSIGVFAGIPKEYDNRESILQIADEALYKAKALGRNKTVVYSSLPQLLASESHLLGSRKSGN